jgi:drug/metabolite transporter (DMT)-like permease
MSKHYFFLILSIISTTFVQVTLKTLSQNHSGNILSVIKDYRLILIIGLYGLALVAWFYAASRIEFTVLISFHILVLVLGGLSGYYWFDESLGLRKIIAYILIIIGILLMVSKN